VTPQECGDLLARIVLIDGRTVTPGVILAWHEVLADLDLDDCLDALTAVRRDNPDRIMPAHIRREVADMVEARRMRAKRWVPSPAALDDVDTYLAEYRAWHAAAGRRPSTREVTA